MALGNTRRYRLQQAASAALVVVLLMVLAALPSTTTQAETTTTTRYTVVFNSEQTADGSYELGGDYELYHDTALDLIASAGGTVVTDLARQIGVMVVESSSELFADTMRSSSLVAEVGQDFAWKQFPTFQEAVDSGQLTLVDPDSASSDAEQTGDPLQSLQWDMQQIRAAQAHSLQSGQRSVDVGVLDTGIDVTHVDFHDQSGASNIDLERGRDFTFLGTQNPHVDNHFHGTHVAGTIAAQANGVGVVGVAPNVTLVSVKVCDSSGYCYATPVVEAITYAGDSKLDVINMSFFVDDDELLQSTEFKCNNVEQQRAFRKAVERAISYARGQGVTPVAALGNSDKDLANPEEGNECEVVPAETAGVIGTASVGPDSEKASYSNYGSGAVDITAPGGNGLTGDCSVTILSTMPGNTYGCFKGTSMASPHATGVAALIASQYGSLNSDGDVKLAPSSVEHYLQSTAIDIGLKGNDECFGNGRIDALRAVSGDTSSLFEETPLCPEYAE